MPVMPRHTAFRADRPGVVHEPSYPGTFPARWPITPPCAATVKVLPTRAVCGAVISTPPLANAGPAARVTEARPSAPITATRPPRAFIPVFFVLVMDFPPVDLPHRDLPRTARPTPSRR